MPQDIKQVQRDMSDGFAAAQFRDKQKRQREYENAVVKAKDVSKQIKNYTREGMEDPDQRKWRKSYYRGDQKMAPGDPAMYAPGDQQLKDLYEGSGKYHGYGASALGGSNGAYANQGPMSKAMKVKNTKPGM